MSMRIGPLLLATVALSMASCGGGGDDEPAEREGPPIPKAQLIERADAICERDQARLAAQLADVPRPTEADGIRVLAPYLEINAEAIRSGAERIDALGRPTTDAAVLDDYLDERTTAANALAAAAEAAQEQEANEFDAALRQYGRNQAQEEAVRFGFEVCGLGAGRVTPDAPE